MNQKCKTKCETLGFILDGGIQSGEVTEIYGESGVGKTQVCMQLLLTCMLKPRDGGLYGSLILIKSCPVFAAEKLHELGTKICVSLLEENPLDWILVKKINNPDQIFLVLNQVEQMILNSHEGCRHTRVVVLDSITSFFRHAHDNTSTKFMERTRLLVCEARNMKHISRTYNIAFVVVNEVSDVFDNTLAQGKTFTSCREVKASLGEAWEREIANKMFISIQYNSNSDSCYREWLVLRSTKPPYKGGNVHSTSQTEDWNETKF